MPQRGSKAEMRLDEDFVSLTQAKESLSQQKEMFRALLQEQDNFKGFVKVIMETINSRFDELSREAQDIKPACSLQRKMWMALKTNTINMASAVLQSDVFKVRDSMLAITDKMEYLEGQSRRNSLVINGITESTNETWAETEDKINTVLTEKLKIQKIEMERAPYWKNWRRQTQADCRQIPEAKG